MSGKGTHLELLAVELALFVEQLATCDPRPRPDRISAYSTRMHVLATKGAPQRKTIKFREGFGRARHVGSAGMAASARGARGEARDR